jgi:hypothetical protein
LAPGRGNIGSADMAKIFGNNQAFTATADISITDAQHGPPMAMEASYAFLKGNLRTDIDMTSMKGTTNAAASHRPDETDGHGSGREHLSWRQEVMYLVYPGLKSYTEITPPQAPQTDKTEPKEPKVDVTQIGKDTVDGHPCVENKITFTADDGTQHEMLAWQATDLNNFPIKTEMQANGATITTHFSNVKLSAAGRVVVRSAERLHEVREHPGNDDGQYAAHDASGRRTARRREQLNVMAS